MTMTELLAGDVLVTLSEHAHGALWLGRGGSHARILATDERGALIQPVFTVEGKDETGAPAYVPWVAIAAVKQRSAAPPRVKSGPWPDRPDSPDTTRERVLNRRPGRPRHG